MRAGLNKDVLEITAIGDENYDGTFLSLTMGSNWIEYVPLIIEPTVFLTIIAFL